MSYNFLDKSGLTYFWDKIKGKFVKNIEDTEYTSTNNTLEIESDNTEASFDITEIDGNLVQNGTPTPSAPKYINVVTGKQLLAIEDKSSPSNRIINAQEFNVIPGVAYNTASTLDGTTYQDCAVRVNDTTNISSGSKDIVQFSKIRQNLGINFQKGEKYTVSFWAKRTAGNQGFFTYFYGDAGYATVRAIASSEGTSVGGWGDGSFNWTTYLTSDWKRYWVTYEINPTATADMIAVDKHLLFRQYYSNKIYLAGICVQKGETDGEFVPYVEPTEINLGKQLFDKSAFKFFGAAGLVETDTGVRAYASSTGTYQYGVIALPNSEKLLGRTVTISASITKSASNTGGIVVYQINNNYGLIGNQIGSRLSSNGSITVTFPTSFSSNGTMFGLLFYANVEGTVAVDDYVDYDDIMVIEGSYVEPYADYFEPLEIAGIPDTDVKDKLMYQNGKWYKKYEVGKVVYNGNENWSKNTSLSNSNRNVFEIKKPNNLYTYASNTDVFRGRCTRFNPVSQSATWTYYNFAMTSGLPNSICFTCQASEDIDTFKSSIIRGAILYYALKEPVLELITEPLLVKELNKLLDNREVNGTTYIEFYGKNAVFTTFKANQTPVQKQLDIMSQNVSEVVNKKQFTTADDLKCIDFREYTSIYGSSNDQAGASFYFAQIKPDSFYDVWMVKYRIYASVPNQQQYKQMSDVVIYGSQSGSSFASFNRIYSTNYSCYVYHNLIRMKAAGFTNGYGDILGVGLRGAANRTTSTYGRYFKIEILETHGCKVEMFDKMLKLSQISWHNSTNYNDITEMDGLSVGLQETGDSTITHQLRHNNGTYLAATALYRYQILFSKDETTLLPANAVNNSAATTKTLTTEEFNPFGQIYYYNSTTAVNANAAIAGGTLYQQVNCSLQYAFNVGTTLTTNKDVFIKCTPQSNGMVKLDTSTPIVQDLPTTADSKVYIYLGHASSNYQVELHPMHPVYEFKDNAIRLYKGPSEAVYTDTEKTKLAGIASGATANTGTVTSVAVKMNNTTKGTVTTSGTIDLGTVITAHQDISGKVDKVSGKGLSTNDYTTTEKNKLAGIAEGATAVTVDSAWSDTSTNPIQNKMIKEALTHFQGELSELEENAQQAISGLDSSKAPKASPTFTGTPKAPTATAGTNTTQIATTAFVQTAVSGKQNTLATQTAYTSKGTATKVPQITTNTLGQVTGITEVTITHPTVDSTLDSSSTNAIQNQAVKSAIDGLSRDIAQVEEGLTEDLDGKVDKVNGKGLSTNDFTNTLKTKLDSLPTRKVLYTATAFSNSITLSETKENFDEIEVFFENNNVQQSTKFQVKSGSQRTLLVYGWWDTTTSVHYQPQGLTFNGTSVTYGYNARARFTSGDSQMSYAGNDITITKIVGYKY